MTEFSIEYNPYLVETVFKKNGVEVSAKSRIGQKASKQRLQVMLGKESNWDGLLNEIAKVCNDNEIAVQFKGRKIDFEDLQYYVEKYTGNVKFTLEFEEGKNDNDLEKELDKLFEEIKQKNFPEFQKKNKDGRNIFEAYEDAKNGIFNVSVIATMSSGKSTLINSILHTDLLPSANMATTGTIGRILDNDDMKNYEAICYAEDGETVVYEKGVVDAEILEKYNEDVQVKYIQIEGNIPNVSSDKIHLCLEDTPGPNNSRNDNHERLTQEVIRRKEGVILYVMNATQFGIDDDEELLRDISKEMQMAGKQSHDRFIFVVNKCDELDEEDGELVEDLMKKVKSYLEGFDIIDPILIPTSARLALLIRKEQRGEKLTRTERRDVLAMDDFIEQPLLHFEKYASVMPNVSEEIRKKLDEYHASKNLEEMEALIHTGVPVVEEVISEYVEKYAFPMKIKDSIQDIISILDEIDMKGKFERSIAEDERQLERVRKQIQEANNQYAEGNVIYDDYKKKIGNFQFSEDCDEELYKAENEIRRITVKYNDVGKIEKSEANNMILIL